MSWNSLETPRLDIVIPAHSDDWPHLCRLLDSLQRQTYPKEALRIHVITEGDSEEAKALGIQRSTGDVVGMFCTDNELLDTAFLEVMAYAAMRPEVIGAYTEQYAYVKKDTSLSRYFALLGANDPLCWWLGKADRHSYLTSSDGMPHICYKQFTERLPSLGDNGCFFKRAVLQQVIGNPQDFGSCMCMCEDLKRLGLASYAIIPAELWHRTGESLWVYLKKRWRYTNALYWDKRAIRRWHLVATPRDWALVVAFAFASLLVVPQVCVSLRGARHQPDMAWAWHPVICLSLTLLYTCTFLKSALSFPRWIGQRS